MRMCVRRCLKVHIFVWVYLMFVCVCVRMCVRRCLKVHIFVWVYLNVCVRVCVRVRSAGSIEQASCVGLARAVCIHHI